MRPLIATLPFCPWPDGLCNLSIIRCSLRRVPTPVFAVSVLLIKEIISMIMYSLLFDFLMGLCLITMAGFLRCVPESRVWRLKTKGGQIGRCWHAAWLAPAPPPPASCLMTNVPLEHDVNMLMCLPLLRQHPTDNRSCCVLPT